MKYFPLLLCLSFFFLLICLSCSKEDPSTPGVVVLYTHPVTEITPEGAKFSAEIEYGPNLDVTDYGFVWSEGKDPLNTQPYRISLGEHPASGIYLSEIHSSLKEDTIYHVRSFAKTPDKTYYGKEVSFRSLGSSAPGLTSFHPDTAFWGDTVTIGESHQGKGIAGLSSMFQIPNTLYVTHYKKLHEYDPASDTWRNLKELPVDYLNSVELLSYVYEDALYVVTTYGSRHRVWQYGFGLGDDLYLYTEEGESRTYNIAGNRWDSASAFPGSTGEVPLWHAMESCIFFCLIIGSINIIPLRISGTARRFLFPIPTIHRGTILMPTWRIVTGL